MKLLNNNELQSNIELLVHICIGKRVLAKTVFSLSSVIQIYKPQ